MSSPEYDWDFRALLALDDEERRAAMGEHVLAMIDAAEKGKEDPAGSIIDAVLRARLAAEGDKE